MRRDPGEGIRERAASANHCAGPMRIVVESFHVGKIKHQVCSPYSDHAAARKRSPSRAAPLVIAECSLKSHPFPGDNRNESAASTTTRDTVVRTHEDRNLIPTGC